MMDNVTLEGIVEADEAYLPISYKGNHKKSKDFDMQRAPRKRGSEVHKRGLSKELVCMPCAVDRNGNSIGRATNLGQCSSDDINGLLGGKIKEQSAFCTDGNSVYRKLSRKEGLDLIPLKGGKAKKGIYHIQHINSYHSELKRFIDRFKGVSTKHLNNYLIWHNFVNYAPESEVDKRSILLKFVMTQAMVIHAADISQKPAMPFVTKK
jgi:transposase-like protein